MNKVIIIFAAFCIAFVAAVGPQQNEKPEPYQFQYASTGEDGGTQSRQESGDANGAVKGAYAYTGADGVKRTVTYTADDANGFQAQVQSNEPGVIASNPAGAVYTVQ